MIYVDPTGHVLETVLDVLGLVYDVYDFVQKPTLLGAGFIAWDVVSIFVPVLPGSYIISGFTRADTIIDTTKMGVKGVEGLIASVNTAKKVDKVIDSTSAIKKIDNISDVSKNIKKVDNSLDISKSANNINRATKVADISDALNSGKVVIENGNKYTDLSKIITNNADNMSDGTKIITNQFGKKGGLKHQGVINAVKKLDEKNTITEYGIKVTNSNKSNRFADVVRKVDGKITDIYQVGRVTKKGLPVSRERKALIDIMNSDDGRNAIIHFISYN